MFSLEIVLLGSALAIDAAVVSFAMGLLHLNLSSAERLKRGMIVSSCFGLFQFFMLWLGSVGGYLFTYSSYGYLFQLVVASIFLLIAAKFFQESMSEEERDLKWNFVHILALAFATSIDALAAGVSFGTLPWARAAAFEVGIITFVFCSGFYFATRIFHHIPEKWLLRLACLIFAFLGGKIIWEYVSRGGL